MNGWSSNAVISKAKAIYGNRLLPEDYQELLKKKSISEVAEYLKNTENYKENMRDIQENSVHRGQLEELIKKTHFQYILRLIRFIDMPDKSFYELNLLKREIEVLLTIVRSVVSGSFSVGIAELPVYFIKHSSFDIDELSKVKSYQNLLDLLKNTPYYPILSKYNRTDSLSIDYVAIEQSLDEYYFDTVFSRIDKNYSGKVRQDLRNIILTSIELNNIVKIYRLKKFYKAKKSDIIKVLMLKYSRISLSKIEELIDLDNPDKILSYLQKSEFSKYSDSDDYIYIEYYAERLRYYLAKRYVHYSTEAPKVYAAFSILLDIERENLFNIIEGIRYELPDEDIEKMLIY